MGISRRKPVRRFLLTRVLPPVAVRFIRVAGRTWRYHDVHRERFDRALADERPLVGAFLHARTFQLLHYMSLPENGEWVLMCSKSRDGELMTRIERGLGFTVARGSSGDGGARALVEMIQHVKRDPRLGSCLAVDGSRGPRGIAQLGVITLAQKVGGLVLPVAASADKAFVWRRSWDRTAFPRPFARVFFVFGEPIDVPARMDADQVEELRRHLEERLHALHEEADRLSGFRDTEPLRVRAATV